jgi:hypothetical protein
MTSRDDRPTSPGDRGNPESGPHAGGHLQRAALGVPLVPLGIGIAVVVVAFAVLGYRDYLDEAHGLFDLDGEGKPPAAFSALLLGSAGLAGFLNARDTGERAWALLGAFLLFMAVDEAITLHETLGDATGIGWIKLYLPVAAVGGLAWLAVLRRLWPVPLLRAGWLGGAAAWFVSQVLEHLESGPGGRVEAYEVYATFEEALELVGSALWLLVLLAALQRRARTRATTA